MRTCAAPLTDKTMWKRLLHLTHPDKGGSDELFVWTRELQQHVAEGLELPHPRPSPNDDRVPFDAEMDFRMLTRRAVAMAEDVPLVFGELLGLLFDCYPSDGLGHEHRRGASYKRLAHIGHLVHMTDEERRSWYRVAEGIPLSERHAEHIIAMLKRRA